MRFTEFLERRFCQPQWSDWRNATDPFVLAMTDKRAGRKVAEQNGITVPRLLWTGEVRDIPWRELPDAYVVKDVHGSGAGRVLVMQNRWDALRKREVSPADVVARWLGPVVIEEPVEDESGWMPPIDYKCICFGKHVEVLMVLDRTGPALTCNYYTPDWEPVSTHIIDLIPEGDTILPPSCLAEIVAQSSRLGGALNNMVRCDFYAGKTGPVFGEFCCNPAGARNIPGRKILYDWADEQLGAVWERELGRDVL